MPLIVKYILNSEMSNYSNMNDLELRNIISSEWGEAMSKYYRDKCTLLLIDLFIFFN